MKLIASIILAFAVAFGTLSAATAYTVSLDIIKSRLTGKTLRSDARTVRNGEPAVVVPAGTILTPDDINRIRRAGIDAVDIDGSSSMVPTANSMDRLVGKTLKFGAGDDNGVPIVDADTTLTRSDLEVLGYANVEYVHLKEFSFGLWRYSWVFGLSCIGLVGGALMLRSDAKRQLEKGTASGDGQTLSPDDAIAQARSAVNRLSADLPGMATDHDRLVAILERLDEVQRVQIAAFVDARKKLIGRYGLGGFAGVMDRFAAAERQVNRAWSAAADHELPESVVCIVRAGELFGDVEKLLAD